MNRIFRRITGVVMFFFPLTQLIAQSSPTPPSSARLYVSTKGNDAHSGSKDHPFRTLDMALRKAREMRRLADPSIQQGIQILLYGGLYQHQEPVVIRPEDSGTALSPTRIEALPGEMPVLSGGITVSAWKKAGSGVTGLPAAAKGRVWVTEAPVYGDQVLDFRQLYINNVKAVRAKDTHSGTMNRILSWNHDEQTCWIPAPAARLKSVAGMEMFIHQWWSIAVLRIKDMQVKGDSAKLSFYQPESRVQSEHPWPAPRISKDDGNSAFYLSNAIQFLDEPGEWYLDKLNRKLYYWPRKGEHLQTAKVTVPVLETVVKILGTIDRPVSYISFKGVGIEHATWLRPSKEGHVPHQSGMYMTDAYSLKIPGTADKKTLENQAWVGRPPAAVEVTFSSHTSFEDCRFQHLGSAGLDYKRGNHDDMIKGNVFKDIAGSGIQAGVFSDDTQEVHFPYQPADRREVCTNLLISNNLITDVTNEDWGTLGISAGYVNGIHIDHNDISEVSYSGISMGWGWTRTVTAAMNNRITANRIQRYAKHMYDVSGIYTLSAQPASVIEGNVVDSIYTAPYAHDPKHWFYLYTDEGSSFFTVKDNWTPAEKYLQNANGPGNVWENNGPGVSGAIKDAAGLEKPYRYLLRERATISAGWKINHVKEIKDTKK
ncbi:right-handed parallel beta-helix repeat-containing protein [Pedobacter sp. AW31-3R]|uniref:right-handed parallel beta-helix repeat-containing protein n=1 Tax=Pedobacter sp. AW31-3R TaxID=3445781 RepID=UPI003F9F2BB3